MHLPLLLLYALSSFLLPTRAQFQFFEQMFQGSSSQQPQQPHQQQQQNVPSDSEWYQRNYEAAHCTNYLCPHTLSCVHFPHHCPCAFPGHEDKVELADGSAVCVSKGGFVAGEVAAKVKLARKGVF